MLQRSMMRGQPDGPFGSAVIRPERLELTLSRTPLCSRSALGLAAGLVRMSPRLTGLSASGKGQDLNFRADLAPCPQPDRICPIQPGSLGQTAAMRGARTGGWFSSSTGGDRPRLR